MLKLRLIKNCFVLALAVLFLFEYALWRLAGFNLVTLYNYAKFSSFRIEGKEVRSTPTSAIPRVSPNPQPSIDNGSPKAIRSDMPTPGKISFDIGRCVPVELVNESPSSEQPNHVGGTDQQKQIGELGLGDRVPQNVPIEHNDGIPNNMQQISDQDSELLSNQKGNVAHPQLISRNVVSYDSAVMNRIGDSTRTGETSISNLALEHNEVKEIDNDFAADETSGQFLDVEINRYCVAGTQYSEAIQNSDVNYRGCRDQVILGDSINSLEIYASDIIAEACSELARESVDSCSQV